MAKENDNVERIAKLAKSFIAHNGSCFQSENLWYINWFGMAADIEKHLLANDVGDNEATKIALDISSWVRRNGYTYHSSNLFYVNWTGMAEDLYKYIIKKYGSDECD